MLLELHVKNLALIEQVDVELAQGLNIMTGETGAGKSIIIGSVNLALGQKANKDMIRSGEEYAYVELIFSVEEDKRKKLEELDVYPDQDNLLIVTRKIMSARSVSKINDETVTGAKLRQVTGLLIDIHGQHEHQSLLHLSKHLEILDTYGKSQVVQLKEEIAGTYGEYRRLQEELEKFQADQESRKREEDFLRFEVEEIENAALREGEEEELASQHRKYANGRKIMERLSAAYGAADSESVGNALRQLSEVVEFDNQLKPIQDQLFDAEAILSDVHHAIGAYMDTVTYDEEELTQIEERLDLIRGLQAKYGSTVEAVEKARKEKQTRLEKLENFEEYLHKTEEEYKKAAEKLEKLCEDLSNKRQEAAKSLEKKIRDGLVDLNFLDVRFEMEFRRLDHYTAGGYDEAEFVISTNPGEPLRPLGMVASGGELSRVMLAIKTVLADSDEIPTLIFDEIDTGISGRTAQKVSEKLSIISKNHQVICITHLPQIAAMADCHFEIAKSAAEGKTKTNISPLSQRETETELARLLGGAEITEAVLENAREMKKLAETTKLNLRK